LLQALKTENLKKQYLKKTKLLYRSSQVTTSKVKKLEKQIKNINIHSKSYTICS